MSTSSWRHARLISAAARRDLQRLGSSRSVPLVSRRTFALVVKKSAGKRERTHIFEILLLQDGEQKAGHCVITVGRHGRWVDNETNKCLLSSRQFGEELGRNPRHASRAVGAKAKWNGSGTVGNVELRFVDHQVLQTRWKRMRWRRRRVELEVEGGLSLSVLIDLSCYV